MELGKAIAKTFAKVKANVVIVDLNEEGLKTKVKLEVYSTKIITYKIDVSNYEAFEELVDTTLKELGSIDILVNNVGIFVTKPLVDMNVNTIDKIIKVNINGTVYGCKAVLPVMQKQQAERIINMSSIVAKLGWTGPTVYSLTKVAVLELTTCLAREYAKDPTNENTVLPGFVRTPLWENALNEFTRGDVTKYDELFSSFAQDIPLGRPKK